MSYRLLTLALISSSPNSEAAAIVEVREFEGDYDPTTAVQVLAVERGTDIVDVATRGANKLAEVAKAEAATARRASAN